MSCALGALYLKVLPYFKIWKVFSGQAPACFVNCHTSQAEVPLWQGPWSTKPAAVSGENTTIPAVFPTHGSCRFSALGSCFFVTLGFDPLLWLQEVLLIFMSFWQTCQSLCFCFSRIEFRTESVSSPGQWIVCDTPIFKGLLMTW